MDGFTLRIINPPTGAVLWNANFAGNSFNYEPMADSLWLGVEEIWVYPNSYDKEGNPLYCNTLKIWILDANDNILLNVENLGPIEAGNNYTFDCSTYTLPIPSAPSSPIESMIGMMVVVMMMTMMMKNMEGVLEPAEPKPFSPTKPKLLYPGKEPSEYNQVS